MPTEGDDKHYKGPVTAVEAAAAAESTAASQPKSAPAAVSVSSSPTPAATVQSSSGRVPITPFAKKLASEKGVDISVLPRTGAFGRVCANDVLNAPAHSAKSVDLGSAPTSQYQDIALTGMRQTIAKRLSQSKQTIPHYYLTSEIVVDDLLE